MKFLSLFVLLALVVCAACKNHEEWKGERPGDFDRRPYSNPYA
ncbi:uncharacterized protein [Drosophila takahashii]|nr:uncharacterized protein LOC123003525 [Drosophila takahashii]